MFHVTRKFEYWCARAILNLFFILCKVKLIPRTVQYFLWIVFFVIENNLQIEQERFFLKTKKRTNTSSAKYSILRAENIKVNKNKKYFSIRCYIAMPPVTGNNFFLYGLKLLNQSSRYASQDSLECLCYVRTAFGLPKLWLELPKE